MPIDITHIGAFLAGVGAVLSSAVALWLAHRRAEKECDQRLEAFRQGLHEMDPDQ